MPASSQAMAEIEHLPRPVFPYGDQTRIAGKFFSCFTGRKMSAKMVIPSRSLIGTFFSKIKSSSSALPVAEDLQPG